jgi:hypothetical protein
MVGDVFRNRLKRGFDKLVTTDRRPSNRILAAKKLGSLLKFVSAREMRPSFRGIKSRTKPMPRHGRVRSEVLPQKLILSYALLKLFEVNRTR